MFSTIFFFEIRRWLNTPVFYVYSFVFFAFSVLVMASALGVFDMVSSTTSSPVYVNSPLNVSGFLNSFTTFVYFLLPTIVGAAVYRDFQYNVHQMLFSYPLTKLSYLSAKFLSSIIITVLITSTTIIGFFLAQFLPGVNKDLIGPNSAWAYLQALVLVVIPNLLFFGSIVFALVTFARNIYIGFIFILLLFVLQAFLEQLTANMDNRYLAALFDPFGLEPISYYTKYWTVEEQNTRNLPFFGVVLYNRLIWLSVAVVIMLTVYRWFAFTQSALIFSRKQRGERTTKNNFGGLVRINLPQVTFNYSFWSRLKTAWSLSYYDFKYVVRNWTFIVFMIITVLMVWVTAGVTAQLFGTETYPVTWKMLNTLGSMYSFFLQILIFLFAGMLIQRAENARMANMSDATAVPNWVLFLTKFIALVKMTVLVLLISMFSGIAYQSYAGFYQFEIGHYITELFFLDMLRYLVLIAFSLFIQSFFKNYFVGFFVCLAIIIGTPMLSKIGIEQSIFKFNTGPRYNYSDMNGYGEIRTYLYYRLYWLLFSGVLVGFTLLFWRRGILTGVKERVSVAFQRMRPYVGVSIGLFLVASLGLGTAIYYQNNVVNRYVSAQDREKEAVFYEKSYKRYEHYAQPRIVDVKVDLNIFPNERNYDAVVIYKAVNKSTRPIDTLFIDHGDNLQSIQLGDGAKAISIDTVFNFDMYKLDRTLQPGDTLLITSVVKNKPNNFLFDQSEILRNGTFLNNSIFPSLGYNESIELVDNDIRKKYGLPEKERMAEPTDTLALQNTYISNDADWISFETTVSTSEDQIALAPGYLQKEWTTGGRRYFHYKMDKEMLNFYSFVSARYEVRKEKWKGVNLEIYYHKGHEYNLDRIMASMKKSFDYYSSQFSPYQFEQMRIIEFPKTHGTFAQAFANTVPFSESIGFIAKVDEENPNKVDYPYSVISHELAHQWWAHQVIGAKVKGVTMLSESMAEYSSLKVLEHTYGKGQMRKFLKESLDNYLSGRAGEKLKENPLMYNENQQYIHYNKGAVVMYTMSDYLGENNFNSFLKEYIGRTAFQEAPYTTSIEFVKLLKERTPDSLQYLVQDMFETITLYDNAIQKVTSKKIADNTYQVDIEFNVSKYRTDEKGKRSYEDIKGTAINGRG